MMNRQLENYGSFRPLSLRLAAIGFASLLLLAGCGGDDNGTTNASTGSGGSSGTGGSSGGSTGGTGGGIVSPVTFTIGGTVSGLTAGNLAVQNNGGDDLSIASGASTFTFGTPVASGSAYSVGIKTYPYGQSCSLAGQSGTAGTNITSVALTCGDWTAANATVSVFAGSTTGGTADGTGTSARFNWPYSVTIDASGTFFITDRSNNMIRKISPAGVVTTLAGSTTSGSADGTGASATFNSPEGIAIDASGNAFVSDYSNSLIRKITPAGVVTTFAGAVAGGNLDGTGTAARFQFPLGIVMDASGNLFVADQGNNTIRKITPAGVVTTFAGSGVIGATDGTGTAATFSAPSGLAIDKAGNLYVADYSNNAIRKITPAGVVTTLAGGTNGSADGTGASAQFQGPFGVAVDGAGNVYVGDSQNNLIRKVTSAGVVTTLAGGLMSGPTNGSGTTARFNTPSGLAVDAAGDLYIADRGNNEIRKISRAP